MEKKGLKRKIVAGLAALVVLGTVIKLPMTAQTAYAEEVQIPTETNTSFAKAREMEFGISIAGTLSTSDSKRYYKFSLGQASKLDLGLERNDWQYAWIYITIYDASQTEIYSDRGYGSSFSLNSIYLTGGDYYMVLSEDRNETFSFIVNMDSMGESFTETQDSNNDRASDASAISLKKKYKGVLAQNDDIDYYTLPKQI